LRTSRKIAPEKYSENFQIIEGLYRKCFQNWYSQICL